MTLNIPLFAPEMCVTDDGDREWYASGTGFVRGIFEGTDVRIIHRLDGPAAELPDGTEEWAVISTWSTNHDACRAASNPATPMEELDELSNDDDPVVVALVAGNPNSDVSLLTDLSSHDDPLVVTIVAANPNTPEDVVYTLCNHDDTGVREAATQNPQCPPEGHVLVELRRRDH